VTTAIVVDATLDQYARVLGRFPEYAARGVHSRRAGTRTWTIFGSGDGDENGLRTLGSFAFTAALIAARAEDIVPTHATGVAEQCLAWGRSAIG